MVAILLLILAFTAAGWWATRPSLAGSPRLMLVLLYALAMVAVLAAVLRLLALLRR